MKMLAKNLNFSNFEDPLFSQILLGTVIISLLKTKKKTKTTWVASRKAAFFIVVGSIVPKQIFLTGKCGAHLLLNSFLVTPDPFIYGKIGRSGTCSTQKNLRFLSDKSFFFIFFILLPFLVFFPQIFSIL